ncbi:MAG: nuclear transport factor 2 family protein [Actinomycetales bacterium]|nr:nuclear transport factor 2 family protein [Actinomycetales bacterium]
MSDARSAREVVTAHYVNAGAGDMEAAFADLSPAIVWTESAGSAYAGTFVGLPAVFENIFGRINADWEDFGAIPESIIADETSGTVAVLANYVGTYRATGKPQNVRVVHVWTVVDGSIVAFEQIVDSALQNLSMN